jgi:hypothetical protein
MNWNRNDRESDDVKKDHEESLDMWDEMFKILDEMNKVIENGKRKKRLPRQKPEASRK